MPIFERHLVDAQIYLSRSVELDALVSRLVLLVSSHSSDFPLLEPLIDAIDEAIANIERMRKIEASGPNHTLHSHFVKLKSRARLFQKLDATMVEAGRVVDEGNTIVLRWHSELGALQLLKRIEN